MRTFPVLGFCSIWLGLSASVSGQTPVFNRVQFNSSAGLALQGDASISGQRAVLTPAVAGKVGGVWHSQKRNLRDGFETTFTFQISESNNGGGEGLAFVIQNAAVPSLGPAGPAMGYGGLNNSVALEFDTRQSSVSEPAVSHISFQARGTAPNVQTNSSDHSASLGSVATGLPNFADGAVHSARVVYGAGNLAVYVDGGATPVLNVSIELTNRITFDRGQAWFGFTASNGQGAQKHEILSWSLTTANSAVAVDITSPLDHSSYVAPAVVPLSATASAAGGNVTKVEYFAGARRVGQALASPFSFQWESVAPGAYLITAVATDSLGRSNVSPPIEVVVLGERAPIGIKFLPSNGGAALAMEPPDLAGVVPQRNWNNVLVFTNGTTAGQNFRDALGQGTTLDLSADFANAAEQPLLNASLSGGHKMMKSYGNDQGGTAGFQTNSIISISQIPFALYDLILYVDGNNGVGDRVAQVRLGTNVVFLRDATYASFSGIYAQGTGTSDAARNTSAGNYVRFTGLTSNSTTIIVTAGSATDGTRRAPINGIQILPSVYDTTVPPTITRGPYLQTGTPRSMIVRWRTNRPVNSRVRYGLDPGDLNQIVEDSASTTEHTIQLTNLTADTRYYYAVGTSATNIAFGNDYTFLTSPSSAKPTRIWVIGDAGTAGNGSPDRQRSTRDAYLNLDPGRHTDVFLMLGDNAYNSGTDPEFQAAVFDMYPMLLRQTPVWSCVGNHETAQSHTYNANIPYYRNFDLPRNGEAGGIASGTEQYYSFDYGNIHFVVLDAMTSDRTTNGVMYSWLQQDLEANTNHWLIGLWHHPPYTKGSHDSDNPNGADFELVEMRENILPLLESYGIDLVLSGHSHAYERSYLVRGHYGYSTNIEPSMFVNHTSGRFDEDEPYFKLPTTQTPYEGTVYVVAGSSGQATFATTPDQTFNTTNHPVMFYSVLELGSLVLDIGGARLEGRFLRENGEIEDTFTIIKAMPAAASGFRVTSVSVEKSVVSLRWSSTLGSRYVVQRSTSLTNPDWVPVSGSLQADGSSTTWNGPVPPGANHLFFRVVSEAE